MSSTGPIAPGTLVAGRYHVDEPLAGEGSAAVYRATDTRLDRAVALRALDAAQAGGAQQGKAAARLVHPNVARVLDFGTDTELGVEFVVADLGTGGSLAALLAQRGVPPLALALRMVQEAAAGLAAAHRAGLVHGDLHPGVLWLSRDEGRLRVQVLGLGLNPAGGPPPRSTARYASPERLRRARELAPAADVFSLGAIAHEVFAGLPADWNQLLLAMARGQAVVAPSLLETRPDLPAHVAQAVRRALMSDPASRWPDAGEMAAHLIADAAAQPHAVDAPAVAVPAIFPAPAAAEAPPAATASFEPQPIAAEAVAAADPEPSAASAASAVDAVAVADAHPASADTEPATAPVSAVAEPEPAPAVAESAEPVASAEIQPSAPEAAAEPAQAEAPASRPARQPLTAGRRAKPIALASTDLADTLYIPPTLQKRAEPASAPAAASAETQRPAPAVPPAAEIVAPPPAIAAAPPQPAPEPVVAAVQETAPAAEEDRTIAAPQAVPASIPVVVAETSAPAAVEAESGPIPMPERRRRGGMERLGQPSAGHRRGMLAAGIVVAVIVVGGVVAKTVLAGGNAADAPAVQSLASRAAASVGGAPPTGQPQAPLADSATPGAVDTAAQAALTPEEQRKQEEERRKQEDLRKQQQRQQDSLRQARLAAQTALPGAALPQQVALQNAPRPETALPAPRLEQRPQTAAASPPPAPAEPVRPAADPNRVYSAEELDTRPSLANSSAFRSAVNRSYPNVLRGSNTWGSAVVSFVVLPDGRVDRSSISVGEASHPAFRSAAAAAISNVRFNPARVGGQAVRTQVSMPITWQAGERDDDDRE